MVKASQKIEFTRIPGDACILVAKIPKIGIHGCGRGSWGGMRHGVGKPCVGAVSLSGRFAPSLLPDVEGTSVANKITEVPTDSAQDFGVCRVS